MSESEPSILPQPLDYGVEPPRRLRTYVRVGLTLFDQGIVSIATYLTAVLISRATPGGFGLYTLVFTLWIFGGEAHNSLISTPQMLRLPKLGRARARQFNGSLLLHGFGLSVLLIILLLVGAAVTAITQRVANVESLRDIPLVLVMAAVSIGPIALRNFARNFCFATRDAVSALTLDVGVSLVQLGGVGLLYFYGELHHWWLAVIIVAAANLFSSLLWLSMARDRFVPIVRRAVVDMRQNWRLSQPIFLSSVLWTAGMYLYPWMISLIAGQDSAGVWAACFALASLGNPLVMGIQNVMGPAIAHAHADRNAAGFRHYVVRCSFLYALLVLPACVVMAVFAEFLITHINGPHYAGYGHVTGILAFTMLLQGVSFPTSRGLFSLDRAKLDMLANIGPLVVLATMGAFLVSRYGVTGAAVCLVVAQIIGSAARVIAFMRVSRVQAPVQSSLAPATSEVAA